MRNNDEWCEQENWDRERRLERDEHREPYRRPRVRLTDAGQLQPPVKTGGGR